MDNRSLARDIVRRAFAHTRSSSVTNRNLPKGWQATAIRRLLARGKDRALFLEHLSREFSRVTGESLSLALQFRPEELLDLTGTQLVEFIEGGLEAILPKASEQFSAAFRSVGISRVPPSDEPVSNTSRVRVFYATDRKEIRPRTGEIRYNKERSPSGQLQYGECDVSIPKVHKVGKVEAPSLLRLEFRPNPKKHVILAEIRGLREQVFLERVASSVAKSRAKDAFVFVHGYNVSFEHAARRTAQIAFDLQFVGAPIFYSWPSNGKTPAYIKDETNIAWSSPHFQRFLSLLAQHSGAERIHVIAHSMGNRAVCDALRSFSCDPNARIRFTHLVLAAPDIDADTFRELSAALQGLSNRVTLYESSRDKAILASKKIHGNPRAGEPLLVISGMDTIDASSIDTDFLGHSYFSDSWPLLSDIHAILFKDDPPASRFGLQEMEHPDGRYYAFRS